MLRGDRAEFAAETLAWRLSTAVQFRSFEADQDQPTIQCIGCGTFQGHKPQSSEMDFLSSKVMGVCSCAKRIAMVTFSSATFQIQLPRQHKTQQHNTTAKLTEVRISAQWRISVCHHISTRALVLWKKLDTKFRSSKPPQIYDLLKTTLQKDSA